MAAIRGGECGPDGLGGAYANEIETDRSIAWFGAGAKQGVLKGFDWTQVPGQMQLTVSAGAALLSELDGSGNVQDRGYLVWADTDTVVDFGAASVSARNDCLVAAFVDTEDGAVGTGSLAVGAHLVVVPGVSGTTTVRSDADIRGWLGRGGYVRLADVPIASTDTQIETANVVDARVPAVGVRQKFTPKVYAEAAPTTPVATTVFTCWYEYLSADVVLAHADVKITSSTTDPLIDLPVPAQYRQLGIGSCGLWGSSAAADQNGQAHMFTDFGKLVCAVAWTTGYRDANAGDVCRYTVMYTVAAE